MGESESARLRRVREHLLHPNRRGHGVRLAIAIVLLLVTAAPIERNAVSSIEREIFVAINSWPDWLDPLLSTVMQLGNFLAVPIVALVALAWTRRFRIGLDLALAGTAAWFLARLVKELIVRQRPAELLSDVILRGPPATGLGYVSGHSAVAAALATVAAAYLGAKGTVAVIVLAAVVAVSRVYVGAHLPLDVIGGAMMGWALGSLIHFLLLPKLTREPAA
jgi:glycosyltransferase 2 family protein